MARREQAAVGEPVTVGQIGGAQLRAIVERIERLEAEKKAIADDIKDVYAEAKANGFDPAALKALVKYRKEDAAKRAQREALFDLYLAALGDYGSTPLGEASARSASGRA